MTVARKTIMLVELRVKQDLTDKDTQEARNIMNKAIAEIESKTKVTCNWSLNAVKQGKDESIF